MTRPLPSSLPKEQSGLWVLWSLLAFFITFASVDAYFVYKAVSTHSGLITEDAYKKGLKYNDTLTAARNQENSGIKATARFENGVLYFRLIDANQAGIEGAAVKAALLRPIDAKYDFNTVLENKGQGNYEARLPLPLKGLWRAHLEAQWINQQQKPQSYTLALDFTAP